MAERYPGQIWAVFKTVIASLRTSVFIKAGLLRSLKPVIINFAVTYKCNSRCRMCNIWKIYKEEPIRANYELSAQEIGECFERNHELLKSVRFIGISGGEPFLKEDLVELVRNIHQVLPRCKLSVVTNGYTPRLIEQKAEAIGDVVGNSLVNIAISIDGREKIHDEMRGINGAYAKAIEALERLVELRKRVPSLNVSLSTTVMPYNFREVDFIYELAKKYRIGFSFRPVHFSEFYFMNLDMLKSRCMEFNPKIVVEFLNKFLEKLTSEYVRGKSVISFMDLCFMSGISDFMRDPDYRRIRCLAGRLSFFLDPYGNVYPCLIMDRPIGNIKEESLKSIWSSKMSEEIREQIWKGNCPNCWTECERHRDVGAAFPHMVTYYSRGLWSSIVKRSL